MRKTPCEVDGDDQRLVGDEKVGLAAEGGDEAPYVGADIVGVGAVLQQQASELQGDMRDGVDWDAAGVMCHGVSPRR